MSNVAAGKIRIAQYPSPPVWLRWLLLAGALLAVGLAYAMFPGFRAISYRVLMPLASGDVRVLKDFILSFGWWAPVISFLLMILQTLIAPLPAFILTIANAMAFGFFYGFLLTYISAMAAALIAFFITRSLGRPFVERWLQGRSLDASFERYGAWGVLALRLIPVVSFDFVSFAAGLTAMRARHFALATIVGMFPASVAYSLLGNSIDSAGRWSLIGGTILLVVLLLGTFFFRRTKAWENFRPSPGVSAKKVN